MMINAKLVTCGLCQSYYSDPRQIPCTHSFCFDCISGCLNEETLILICPKCNKIHQYQSIEQFHQRCMPDGFLSSMVAQFKKNQSRLTSRPSSTISHLSSPIPPNSVIQENNSNHLNSDQQRQTPRSTLVAKCQSCNIRGELIVCQHCDNVICSQCVKEHSNVLTKDVKNEWQICKTKFENLNQQSTRFDQDQEEMSKRAKQLQTFIITHSGQLVQTIEDTKKKYLDLIEKHRRTYKQSFAQEEVIDEYESIDKRLGALLKSSDVSSDTINDFLFEIEHLETRLDNLNKQFDTNQIKFPQLTFDEKISISSLFGTLEYVDLHSDQLPQTNENSNIENKLDVDDEYILIDSVSSNEQKKKLLWQIDYFSVPYYVRTYNNQLFVCDKYGSLAIYKLNGQSKPSLIREVKLFKDTLSIPTMNDEDQTIIDSFTIYRFWIIVFKRKKNELQGSIYLFTHDGKPVPNGKFSHNYPSRELTVDTECNLLWSLDQKQLCLFVYDLPETKPANPEEYFQIRHSHVQFAKPFAPIHISANKNSLAVLDKNRQAIHVYEKKTRRQLYEYVNTSYISTHFCWDMALFSDNNLLIKLDEMSTLKSGPSKHIYLQLDAKRQYSIIGSIEEIDAYGMMITANDEILIGVRINTKGIIKCYV